MGATFDRGTTSALFANTTFKLDPEKLGFPSTGIEHLQARVRFTRSVRGDHFGLNQVQSQQSDPFLIEFHPGNQQINVVYDRRPYGEYVALAAAGVISERALYDLSECRGRAIKDTTHDEAGTMAAVQADA